MPVAYGLLRQGLSVASPGEQQQHDGGFPCSWAYSEGGRMSLEELRMSTNKNWKWNNKNNPHLSKSAASGLVFQWSPSLFFVGYVTAQLSARPQITPRVEVGEFGAFVHTVHLNRDIAKT